MMCRRVPYLPEHANLLKPRKQFSQMEVESIDRFVGIPYSYMETVMLEDEPVAVLGMVLLWKGVAEVWTVISEAAKKPLTKIKMKIETASNQRLSGTMGTISYFVLRSGRWE